MLRQLLSDTILPACQRLSTPLVKMPGRSRYNYLHRLYNVKRHHEYRFKRPKSKAALLNN